MTRATTAVNETTAAMAAAAAAKIAGITKEKRP